MNQSSHRQELEKNRRRFHRIDDEVILNYQELLVGGGDGHLSGKDRRVAKAFAACAQLAEYRCRMQPLLSQVRRESPTTARLLGLFKEKTDLLANLLLEEELGSLAQYRSKVELSAGGISFRTPKEFRENVVLSIQMILLPSFVGIDAQGRVVRGKQYLREIDGCLYETSVEFVNMKESTRDLIAKHVFDKTSEQLRKTRQRERYASASPL